MSSFILAFDINRKEQKYSADFLINQKCPSNRDVEWEVLAGVFLPPCPREITRISQHSTTSPVPLRYCKCHAHKPPILETEVYTELGQMRLSFLFNFYPEKTLHFVTCKFILIQVQCMGHYTVSTLRYFATLKKYVLFPSNTNSSQYLFLLIF